MDREKHHNLIIGAKSDGVSENSSDYALEAVIVLDSEENAGFKGETGDRGVEKDESGSKIREYVLENDERTVQKDARSSSINSNTSVHDVVSDDNIVITPHEAPCVSRENKTVVETPKPKVDEEVADSHVKLDGEIVCRICHLSFDRSPQASCSTRGGIINMDMIQIGCGCKEELGIAHVDCAEAWFKLRGNRLCEICGQTAKNITSPGDDHLVEEWNEHRFSYDSDGSSNRRRSCWRGQPFCNFLMACLVIAFVLPWFFHLDMF